MNDISNLKTYSKNHSLSEAVFTIFLAQEILKPERFEELLNDRFKEFQEFTPKFSHNINIKGGGLELKEKKIDGFVFKKFNQGKPEWVINSKNKPVPYIAIHCLNYDRWIPFTEKIEFYLGAIAEFQKDLFIKAFGLNNIDQFYWIGKNFPELEIIFKKESELLPLKFFASKEDFTYTIKQTLHKADLVRGKYVDRIDIFGKGAGSNNLNIGIIHNVIKELDEVVEIQYLVDEFSKSENDFNWAHQHNKEILKNLFSKEVVELIKLK